MNSEFKVVFTGDTKKLDDASAKAAASMSKLDKQVSQLKTDIASNVNITNGYANAIDALNNELKSGLISQDQFAKSLNRLQRDEKETSIETINLRKQLAGLERQQRDLGKAYPKLAKSATGLNKATGNANNTLQEFSRVIQDAPYGIQGVGNNITQLVSNFGHLKNATGSTIGAFKALASSFLGSGGILFVISTAVSLLTVYGGELFKAAEKTETLEEKTKRNKEAFDNYISSLRGASKASLNSQKNSAKELRTLQNLRDRIEDTTKSQEERTIAVNKLQDLYPEVFSNAKEEELLNGQLTASYDKLTNAIISRSKATAASEVLVENAKKEFEIDSRLNQIKADLVKNEIELNKAKTESNKLDGTSGQFGDSYQAGQKEAQALGLVNETKKKGNDLVQEELDLKKELLKINEENSKLEQIVSANVIVEPNFKSSSKGDGSGFRPKVEIVPTVEESGIKELGEGLKAGLEGLNDYVPVDFLDEFSRNLDRARLKAEIFGDAVGNSFSTLADSVSSSLSTGNAVVDSFTSSIISSLANLGAAYIANMILEKTLMGSKISTDAAKANSSGIVIATNAAAALGPAGAFALPGLIASQLALINSAFAGVASAGSFANGGFIGGGFNSGDKLLANVNSGEAILNTGQQRNFMRLANGAGIGATASNELSADIVLRGSNQVIQLRRAQRKQQRFNS